MRLALASCRAPVRVVRRDGGIAVETSDDDAMRGRARWFRAGLCTGRSADAWPDARPARAGLLFAATSWWCVGAAPLAGVPRVGHAILLLTPVAREEALRALANALASPLRNPFRRAPRPLARVAAAVASGVDGVVLARAYLLASGMTPAEARRSFARERGPGVRRARADALRAWRDIATQSSGVWRPLSALEAWWS